MHIRIDAGSENQWNKGKEMRCGRTGGYQQINKYTNKINKKKSRNCIPEQHGHSLREPVEYKGRK